MSEEICWCFYRSIGFLIFSHYGDNVYVRLNAEISEMNMNLFPVIADGLGWPVYKLLNAEQNLYLDIHFLLVRLACFRT